MRSAFPGVILLGILLVAGSVDAQIAGVPPAELEGIEITDRAGEPVPTGIRLRTESGDEVLLGDLLVEDRPVLVQMVYYNCPMLCSLVLNGYLDAAKELDWIPGRDYEVLSVSFDPRDTPEVAGSKKKNYVAALEKPEAATGWHFLTAEESQSQALAEALGFRYRWVPAQKEYAHAAGMFVLTPTGKISRTLYGISFTPQDLKFSLMEASEGRLGSPMDRLLLYCFQYDAETHKYALVARNVMKIGGGLIVLLLSSFLLMQWRRERRHSRPVAA